MGTFFRKHRCEIAIGALLFSSVTSYAAIPVTTFGQGMTAFVENSSGTLIFATEPGQNGVAVINASTLQVTKVISTGLNPLGLSLSIDGSTLYVANQGSSSIGVIDTSTLMAKPSIDLGTGVTPLAVTRGAGNRLWVLTGRQGKFASIVQIDATTGTSTGPNVKGSPLIFGGNLVGSADGNTLYYAVYGTSPAYLSKFDISGPTATNVWTTSPGSNGGDLEVSTDGTLIALICGGGNNGVSIYGDAIYSTSDGSFLGGFPIGAYPGELAFSPDSGFAYASESSINTNVSFFDLSTYTKTDTIALF